MTFIELVDKHPIATIILGTILIVFITGIIFGLFETIQKAFKK